MNSPDQRALPDEPVFEFVFRVWPDGRRERFARQLALRDGRLVAARAQGDRALEALEVLHSEHKRPRRRVEIDR